MAKHRRNLPSVPSSQQLRQCWFFSVTLFTSNKLNQEAVFSLQNFSSCCYGLTVYFYGSIICRPADSWSSLFSGTRSEPPSQKWSMWSMVFLVFGPQYPVSFLFLLVLSVKLHSVCTRYVCKMTLQSVLLQQKCLIKLSRTRSEYTVWLFITASY